MTKPNKGRGEGIKFLKSHVAHADKVACLPWPLFVNPKGYGILGHNGKMWRAHRLMCVLAHGKPPTKAHVAAHECNNRACCNPNHLKWKTSTENHLDQRPAGTQATSRYGWRGVLSNAEVAAIRAAEGTTTQAKLAHRYEVSADTIRRIHRGQTYTGKAIDWQGINRRNALARLSRNQKSA
jgi:hypothetical protein